MDLLTLIIAFSIAYSIGYWTGKNEKDKQVNFDEESY